MTPGIILLLPISAFVFIWLLYGVRRVYENPLFHSNEPNKCYFKIDDILIDGNSIPFKQKTHGTMNRELIHGTELFQGKKDHTFINSASIDRRIHRRRPFNSDVNLIRDEKLFKETSKNLSLSGIYLKSNRTDQYKINNILTLTFQTSNGKPKKYIGKVVRKDDGGIGVQFLKDYF